VSECKPLPVGGAPAPALHPLPGQCGRVVQAEPIRPTLKAPGTKRLELKCDEPVSEFASKFNWRRYNVVAGMVACTGAQFCGFAQIETKKQAYTVAGAYTRSRL
jgi:hypothetical protein